MEEFMNLPWRISEPSMIDIGTNFLKEETIGQSFVFQNNFVPFPVENVQSNPKKKQNKFTQTSRLNVLQHKQCLQALELLESGKPINLFSLKEQQVINIYKNLMSVIKEENAEFLKFVEYRWKNFSQKNEQYCVKILYDFATAKRKLKLERVLNYPQFYLNDLMVSLSKTNIDVDITQCCLLELGKVAELKIPDVEKNPNMNVKKILSFKPNSLEDYLENTTSSVSEDIQAEFLAKQTKSNFIISSSSLKTILDNFGPDFNTSWDIPIVVKEYEINGSKFNVVYLDKTLPGKTITNIDLNYNVRKTVLKLNTCFEPVHSFPVSQIILDNFNSHIINKKPVSKMKNDKVEDIFDECSLPKKQKLIPDSPASPEPESQQNKAENQQINNKNQTVISNLNQDLEQSDIKNQNEEKNNEKNTLISDSPASPEPETEQNNARNRPKRNKKPKLRSHSPESKINKERKPNFHNVNYRLWTLKVKENANILLKNSEPRKEIKLIVRSKTDAYKVGENGQFIPFNIVPKLEQQLDFGVEIVTKSELIRQWSMLFFRPFSNLLRVRIHPKSNKFIKMETININKITHECLKHYNFTPKDSLNILYNVLAKLMDLNPGNYVLHHTAKHGPFAELMKNISDGSNSTLNLHEVYNESNCNIIPLTKWNPVDTTVVLPQHVKDGQMPGLFPPEKIGKNKRNKRKKKGKKKQNKIIVC